MNHFFFPNSSVHLRSDAHQSQIIGGDADVDHSKTIGGDTIKLLEGYIPHHPWVSAPLARKQNSYLSFFCLQFANFELKFDFELNFDLKKKNTEH